jgi:hypothetical protein
MYIYCLIFHFINNNIKIDRATRGDYGDNAVEFVQVKREGKNVFLKALVCPETKIKSKSYNVTAELDGDAILSAQCHDCKASRGKLYYLYYIILKL